MDMPCFLKSYYRILAYMYSFVFTIETASILKGNVGVLGYLCNQPISII
ncbi:hypothetical protein BTN49_1393 [Candidatus Enterovibrio escicola]|uniref:Uncharacterized protein n=1 Tax=Candidatus Enterovibrio escicola TaxID=1927127 RepID=A0A2A5T3W0_9GAMM|nr:hypothetical protein BTN49_1393 [Candidatus Enterovibrio escacola]